MDVLNLSSITLTPLRRIETVGGDVLHALKSSDDGYAGFGEAYFSWISSGAIKAWKKHLRMTMNVVVPVGNVKFVFRYIDLQTGDESFRIEEIGEKNYVRLTVPPGIWFGFQGLDNSQSLVLNIANIPHDPDEVERVNMADCNFRWSDI
jgi:dTDP-4-dehydrorhamnose 3,5-epimerase